MFDSNSVDTGRVLVTEHKTYEQATHASYSEVANTGGWCFPVVVFQQASRMLMSGAFPINFVESRLFSKSALAGSGVFEAKNSMNRPEIKEHVHAIAKYIKENVGSKYILPPLTLNVQEAVALHTIEAGANYKAGYLVIPSGVNLSITDGQHRVKGIIEAYMQLQKEDNPLAKRLGLDSISVMITCEHEVKQIHQDFADCSKTKPLPPSLLSLYDTRNPGNRLVFDMEDKSALFRGRIDSTSKTLSKKSSYIFLANQLRQMIKHLLLRGNPTDIAFEKRAMELLSTETNYNNYYNKYQAYIDELTNVIPIWSEITTLPLDGPKRQLIPKYREAGWICLTATGLNILGSLGYDLFTNDVENWQDYVKKLAHVDWSRDGELWQGNIVQSGRLMTSTSPIKKAVENLESALGFDVSYYKTSLFNSGEHNE